MWDRENECFVYSYSLASSTTVEIDDVIHFEFCWQI